MDLSKNDTAVVLTDSQNDVLSEKGVVWGLVGDSVKENQTAEDVERTTIAEGLTVLFAKVPAARSVSTR